MIQSLKELKEIEERMTAPTSLGYHYSHKDDPKKVFDTIRVLLEVARAAKEVSKTMEGDCPCGTCKALDKLSPGLLENK